MSKLICGIGYNSKGKYRSAENRKITPAYQTWRDMIRRCYDLKVQEKHPTYIGCSVDKEWHDYQEFAEWFYSHAYSGLGYSLDKDILLPGNKIYSPDTCCFVPAKINNLLIDSASIRGDYPMGVHWNKIAGKYQATMSYDGKQRALGLFDTPDKAYQLYKSIKERHIKNKALEWANRIEWCVFAALMKWQLDD